MAEENSDQNIAQPQNDAQQAAPQVPDGTIADQTQTSITEPIAMHDADERPTTAMPAADAAPTDDTPDYASAAGERTVITSSTTPSQDAPTEQYRPAPEYGAYGPTPTQPANNDAAAGNGAPAQPQGQPQYGAYGMGQSGQPRQPFFGNPYASGNQQNGNGIRPGSKAPRSRRVARTCRRQAMAIRSATPDRAFRSSLACRRPRPSASPAGPAT